MKNRSTRPASIPRCGTTDPGTAANANKNNNTNAVRIDVNCRHTHRPNSPGDKPDGNDEGDGG